MLDLIDIVALAAVLIPEPVSSAAGATALGVKGAATGAKVVAKTGAKLPLKGLLKKQLKNKHVRCLLIKQKRKQKRKRRI